MIIGQGLLLEVKLYLRFSKYTIKGNVGTYKGCTTRIKDPYDLCDDESLRNEDFWESEHLLNSTERMLRILDANYQKAD